MPTIVVLPNTSTSFTADHNTGAVWPFNAWGGGTSPNGSASASDINWTPPNGPKNAFVGFNFETPSEIDLPTNANITAITLTYDLTINYSYTDLSGGDPSFDIFMSSTLSLGHFPSGFVNSPLIGASFFANFPNNFTGPQTMTLSSIPDPYTRTAFIADMCQNISVDGTIGAGFNHYTPFQHSIFLPLYDAAFHNTFNGQFIISNVQLNVTYSAPNPCWFNALTNKWQAAATSPGSDWQSRDCPAPTTATTVNPVFGSTNGGD